MPLSVDENDVILQALVQSGQKAQQAISESFEVFEKGRDDYVTSVDQALDRYLSSIFSAQFPTDGIITEENQRSAAEFQESYPRIWFIDPIDGTEDFINRGQHYSVMVGLLSNHTPQAGWIHAPAQNKLYWGGPEWGLFQHSHHGEVIPLKPNPQSLENNSMLLGSRDQRRFGAAITQQIPNLKFDAVGSFGLKVIEVIEGRAGIYVYLNGRVKLWDTTGPLALAKAAGLVCCDLDGAAIRFDANSIYPATLMHRQPIIIGWPKVIESWLPPLRQAVMAVRSNELGLSQVV